MSVDWDDRNELPSPWALQEIHDCLLMVRYWRERAEIAEAINRKAVKAATQQQK